jgi:uncharacterized coiled-coil protein SlyX
VALNERKTKIDHAEVLSSVHKQNILEQEKLRGRIKQLENDLSNKSLEIDKLNEQISESRKSLSLKREESEKTTRQHETS